MRGYFADASVAHYKEKPPAIPISNEFLRDGPAVRAPVLTVSIRSFLGKPMLLLRLKIVMGHDFPKAMDFDLSGRQKGNHLGSNYVRLCQPAIEVEGHLY